MTVNQQSSPIHSLARMYTMKNSSFGSNGFGSDERQQEDDIASFEDQQKHFNIRKSPFYRKSVQQGRSLANFQKPKNKMLLLKNSFDD